MSGQILRYTANFNFPIIAFDVATWHEYMYNFMDTLDALLARYISAPGLVNEGIWVNSTAYVVNDLTVDNVDGTIWQCLVSHTSAASPTLFAADRAANPTYWSNYSVLIRDKGAWLTATDYGVGDIVSNGGVIYHCVAGHTSGVFSTDLAAGKWVILINYASQNFATVTPGDALKTVRVNAGATGFEYYTPTLGGDLAALDTVSTNYIDDDAVTYAKMQNVSAQYRLLGRSSSGAGNVEEIVTSAYILNLLDDANAGAARTTLGLGALSVLNTINSSTLLDDDVVTLPKIANIANMRVLGNTSGGSQSPTEVTVESSITAATGTSIPSTAATKNYVDSVIYRRLRQEVASASSTITFEHGTNGVLFNISEGEYIFELARIKPSIPGAHIRLEIKHNGTWLAAGYYGHVTTYTIGTDASAEDGTLSGTHLQFAGANAIGNNTTEGLYGELKMKLRGSSSQNPPPAFEFNGYMFENTAGTMLGVRFFGTTAGTTGNFEAVRFSMSSGNINSGTFNLLVKTQG